MHFQHSIVARFAGLENDDSMCGSGWFRIYES